VLGLVKPLLFLDAVVGTGTIANPSDGAFLICDLNVGNPDLPFVAAVRSLGTLLFVCIVDIGARV